MTTPMGRTELQYGVAIAGAPTRQRRTLSRLQVARSSNGELVASPRKSRRAMRGVESILDGRSNVRGFVGLVEDLV